MPAKHLFIFLLGCFLASFSNGCKTDPVTPPAKGIDTTSHDYAWTVETFGDYNRLPDVAVNTVWSPNDGTTLYAGGSGLFENSGGKWKALEQQKAFARWSDEGLLLFDSQ